MASALAIGLLPAVSPEKIVAVGNAAGVGAKLALISGDISKGAAEVAHKVKHIELSARADFQEQFVEALEF